MQKLLSVGLFFLSVASTDLLSRELNEDNAQTRPSLSLEKRLITAGLPGWLFKLRGQIVIEAEQVTLYDEVVHEVVLPMTLKQDQIKLNRASSKLLGGKVDLNLDINRTTQTFAAAMRFTDMSFRTENNSTKLANDRETRYIFDDTALIPEWSQNLRGSLALTAVNVQFDAIKAQNLQADINFGNSSASLSLTGLTDSGEINGTLDHDYTTKNTAIDFQGQSVPLSLLPAAREYIEDIFFDFSIDISTSGGSARQWVSAMDGKIIAEFDRGKINVQKLDKLSQDILSLTLTSLIPISSTTNRSSIECGAIVLKVAGGVALGQKSIALRTENLAIMGGGMINFLEERLKLALHPHARNTGKLNTKTAIKEVTVDGPFDDLKVKPHLGGIINQGISLTTKIASFGLSKIGLPLLDWAAPADVACMESLQ